MISTNKNTRNMILSLLAFVTLSIFSWASLASIGKGSSLGGKKPIAKDKTKNLKKEMHFSDQMVNGKFQLPGDSAVEVENEKPVFNLLQIRTDFNDRRLKETTRDE